jgi:hypothetical protein
MRFIRTSRPKCGKKERRDRDCKQFDDRPFHRRLHFVRPSRHDHLDQQTRGYKDSSSEGKCLPSRTRSRNFAVSTARSAF